MDLIGKKFYRLTVISEASKWRDGRVRWECICLCGKKKEVLTNLLLTGVTRSCGCLRKENVGNMFRTHGMCWTPTYKSWVSMKRRVTSKKHPMYKRYGGRGISICSRWYDFKNFFNDMGNRPPNLTLERIDNEKDYTPLNCKWATRKEQNNNKISNRKIEFNGYKRNVTQWAKSLGVDPQLIYNRLRRGWTIERILTTPAYDRGQYEKKVSQAFE